MDFVYVERYCSLYYGLGEKEPSYNLIRLHSGKQVMFVSNALQWQNPNAHSEGAFFGNAIDDLRPYVSIS
jgi:hypothetical protein